MHGAPVGAVPAVVGVSLAVRSAQIHKMSKEHSPIPATKVILDVAVLHPHPVSSLDPARELVLDRCLLSEQITPFVTLYLKLLSSHQSPDQFAHDRLNFRAATVPTSRRHHPQHCHVSGDGLPGTPFTWTALRTVTPRFVQ